MDELYLFKDDLIYYGFTPTIFKKVFEGNTYYPAIITRNDLNISDSLTKSGMTIKFARTNNFAKSLLLNLPEKPITLTIYKNSLPYWKGKILSAKANVTSIELGCTSLFSSKLKSGRQILTVPHCRHVLYDTPCGVNQALFAEDYTTTATTNVLTIAGLAQPDGYFNFGKAVMFGQTRYILKHAGTSITLSAPFIGPLVGTITLYPGCSLTEKTCKDKFNNLPNFGGFSRMPIKNPFSSTGLL